MFSQQEKTDLAMKIEAELLKLSHPEMPTEKPEFCLLVKGKESWSYARIVPNHHFNESNPPGNKLWNEVARDVLASLKKSS